MLGLRRIEPLGVFPSVVKEAKMFHIPSPRPVLAMENTELGWVITTPNPTDSVSSVPMDLAPNPFPTNDANPIQEEDGATQDG
jgi:hypothetical protein